MSRHPITADQFMTRSIVLMWLFRLGLLGQVLAFLYIAGRGDGTLAGFARTALKAILWGLGIVCWATVAYLFWTTK